MKKLPIGIYNFSEIVTEGYYYVDKTAYVHQLAHAGKYYFLSWPRRFGKSLFVDTLRYAFEGRRELFKGLYLENAWDFEQVYLVLSFSLGRGRVTSLEELNIRLFSLLDDQAQRHGMQCTYELVADRFAELIRKLQEKAGRRLVVLIDEYDKPILDNLKDVSRAEEMRDGLKNFYSVNPSSEYIDWTQAQTA
ncbi:MAG: AAA family ATPase [Desulfovermiculus sp.]|nr:AAA family ATPase [Desulfovermiculus sp.]